MLTGMKQAIAGQPEPLKRAISRAVEAHRQMRELVGAEFVRLSATMTDDEPVTVLELPDVVSGGDAVSFVPAHDTDRLEELYRSSFEDNRVDWEIKLDDLLALQDTLLERLDKIPATSTVALFRVQAQLDQVDAEIRDTRAKFENAADVFKEASTECDRLGKDWQEAQELVENEASARRKAEAVRKVIARINLTFRPTGRRRPVSELMSIEWIPVGAEVSPQSPAVSKSALERMPLNRNDGPGSLSL
jgi:hypothetical protein